MQKLLLLFALSLLQLGASAQTNVSGIIDTNTTWTKANSPYIVTGHLLVDTAVTLTIEPGVTVKVDGYGTNFFIDGGLIAIGTATDPINFMENKPYSTSMRTWSGLCFRSNNISDTSRFDYCNISNATDGIKLQNGGKEVSITNSTFQYNGTGVFVYSDNVVIKNNKFFYNESPIKTDSWTGGDISYNEIAHCNYSLYIGSSGATKNFVISSNHIHDNGGGIGYSGLLKEMKDNVIERVKGTGISLTGPLWSTVSGNIIVDAELGFYLAGVHGAVTNNTVRNCNDAVRVGQVTSNLTFNNNCIEGTKSYLVIAAVPKPDTVHIGANWWGTSDSAKINDQLLDFYDDFKSGFIKLAPYLTQQDVSCKGVTTGVQNIEQVEAVAVYPNPFHTAFTINLNGARVKEIAVYNPVGTKIAVVSPDIKKEITIDLSQYPAGMYIYQGVYKDNTRFSGKLIKE